VQKRRELSWREPIGDVRERRTDAASASGTVTATAAERIKKGLSMRRGRTQYAWTSTERRRRACIGFKWSADELGLDRVLPDRVRRSSAAWSVNECQDLAMLEDVRIFDSFFFHPS